MQIKWTSLFRPVHMKLLKWRITLFATIITMYLSYLLLPTFVVTYLICYKYQPLVSILSTTGSLIESEEQAVAGYWCIAIQVGREGVLRFEHVHQSIQIIHTLFLKTYAPCTCTTVVGHRVETAHALTCFKDLLYAKVFQHIQRTCIWCISKHGEHFRLGHHISSKIAKNLV